MSGPTARLGFPCSTGSPALQGKLTAFRGAPLSPHAAERDTTAMTNPGKSAALKGRREMRDHVTPRRQRRITEIASIQRANVMFLSVGPPGARPGRGSKPGYTRFWYHAILLGGGGRPRPPSRGHPGYAGTAHWPRRVPALPRLAGEGGSASLSSAPDPAVLA